jgi:hypothetical protein
LEPMLWLCWSTSGRCLLEYIIGTECMPTASSNRWSAPWALRYVRTGSWIGPPLELSWSPCPGGGPFQDPILTRYMLYMGTSLTRKRTPPRGPPSDPRQIPTVRS